MLAWKSILSSFSLFVYVCVFFKESVVAGYMASISKLVALLAGRERKVKLQWKCDTLFLIVVTVLYFVYFASFHSVSKEATKE